MRTILLPLGLCVILSACGGDGVSLTNASADQVAAETKAAGLSARITPGEWQTDVDLTSVDLPGVPAAIRDQMIKATKKPTSHNYCVTEEDANRPGGLFADDSKSCTYEKFEMRESKIDVVMLCPGPQGSNTSMRLTVQGNFSPDAIYATNEIKIDGGGQAIEMKGKINSRRIGDCAK